MTTANNATVQKNCVQDPANQVPLFYVKLNGEDLSRTFLVDPVFWPRCCGGRRWAIQVVLFGFSLDIYLSSVMEDLGRSWYLRGLDSSYRSTFLARNLLQPPTA